MKKAVFRATGLVFLLSLVAKLIGFGKSILEASYFGASLEMDAYNVANGFVSNILYMLTTAIAVAFVPLYIRHSAENRERRIFATRIITAISLATVVLSLALLAASPVIVSVIAPAFDHSTQKLTTDFFRVLVVGTTFSLMANLFTSLLNAERRFGFAAMSSIINSLVLIFFVVLLSWRIGIWALVVATPISFLVQWIALYSVGRRYAGLSLRYGLKDESLKLLLIQAAPVLLSQATVEINQVVDRALLSRIGAGTLTAVANSAVLYQFVTAMISTPVSTVMFTELSEVGARRDMEQMKNLLQDSFRLLILICVPVILVSVFCAQSVVSVVYGHGRFSIEAVRQCAKGLSAYIFCLLPVSVKSVLSRAYYSLNDQKRPMIFGISEVILNIALSLALVGRFGILGVVGATAIASTVFVLVMMMDFNRRFVRIADRHSLTVFWKIEVGMVALGGFLWLANRWVVLPALPDFLVKASAGLLLYFGLLAALRERMLLQLLSHIRKHR